MADYTVKRFDEMPIAFHGAFLLARASLGVSSFGLQIANLPPGTGEHYPNHDHSHDGQEEVYIVLAGGGEMTIDDGEKIALEPEMAIRVAPETKRHVAAGDDGVRMIIVGGVPGKVYEAPSFTEPEGG